MDISKRFGERLRHDPERGEMRDGSIRYLMMRPDALMGMFARLAPDIRAKAVEALTASVAEFGGRSVQAYGLGGASQADALMKTIVETSADLGWGSWTFARDGDGSVRVEVLNSPFAEGAGTRGEAVCVPIAGILTAMAPLLVGEDATVKETCCAAVRQGEPCRFILSAGG
ncbi:hypothetical protein ACO34A_00530 [Rhizobium sp. ACO-34A]|nr:V4R domain-containing protein [Rhizobium sp. ACO-34A]ATN32298.1 hypothetical protein ACO34A_00530 [Rhizobium sp. ACO-34A]